MNPMTEPALSATPVVPAYRAGQRVTLIRVMHSEWTKLWSLPSTLWLLLITVVLVAGGGLLAAVLQLSSLPHGAAAVAAFNPTQLSQTGVGLAELTAGALGALIMTGEYATGQVRLTFTAVPRRLPVLWGKLAVFAGVIFSVSLVASFISFFLGQALLNSQHLGVSIAAPGALRSVIGAALYVTVAGMIGVALGALFRNTAAGIATFAGIFFVIPPLTQLLPASISDHLAQYLPSSAGEAVWGGGRGITDALSPWTGFALLCAYAAVLIAAAALRLRRVDA